MGKKVDWESTYKGALRGNRGKFGSYKELMKKNAEKREQAEKERQLFKKLEPYLKKSLLDHMVNQKPITVKAPITYLTEKMSKSNNPGSIGSFHTTQEQIPKGTNLVYSHWDKTMGQWIFKSSDGSEVAIYDKPVVALPDPRSGVPVEQPNPGFWGLLTSTNIYSDLVEQLNEEDSE